MLFRKMILAGAVLSLVACGDAVPIQEKETNVSPMASPGKGPDGAHDDVEGGTGEISREEATCDEAWLAYDLCREAAATACEAAAAEFVACLEENGVEGDPTDYPIRTDPWDDVIGVEEDTVPEACQALAAEMNGCSMACVDEYFARDEACFHDTPCPTTDDPPEGPSEGKGGGYGGSHGGEDPPPAYGEGGSSGDGSDDR